MLELHAFDACALRAKNQLGMGMELYPDLSPLNRIHSLSGTVGQDSLMYIW